MFTNLELLARAVDEVALILAGYQVQFVSGQSTSTISMLKTRYVVDLPPHSLDNLSGEFISARQDKSIPYKSL